MIQSSSIGARADSLAREFLYTTEDFNRIADLCYERAGILLPPAKQDHVYSRLSRRLRSLGLKSFDAYLKQLTGPNGVEEQRQMISALTTNVTRFFREPHHFEHLRTEVLPELAARARAGGRVRLWSAGCASGEEPYSLAFTVLRALPDAAKYDVRILATDIDPEVLAAASSGIYSEGAAHDLPDWVDHTMASREPDALKIAPSVRRLVDFRPLNLIRPFPMKGPFDVIFCRNVAIYFDVPTQAVVWNSFIGVLQPGSQMYIGHSERPPHALVTRFTPNCITGYRLNDPDRPATSERRK